MPAWKDKLTAPQMHILTAYIWGPVQQALSFCGPNPYASLNPSTSMPAPQAIESDPSPQPWWCFGHVWMVIAGPAVVVVAGFVTLYLALNSPNEIVTDPHYIEPSPGGRLRQAKSGAATSAQAPAMQARNHAQTGVVPVLLSKRA